MEGGGFRRADRVSLAWPPKPEPDPDFITLVTAFGSTAQGLVRCFAQGKPKCRSQRRYTAAWPFGRLVKTFGGGGQTVPRARRGAGKGAGTTGNLNIPRRKKAVF